MIFNYAGTGDDHRMTQIFIRPETQVPAFTTTALTEFWVRGGVVSINGQLTWANCFVIAEPGTQLQMTCPYGALLLAWAHGPLRVDAAQCDLFGYGSAQQAQGHYAISMRFFKPNLLKTLMNTAYTAL